MFNYKDINFIKIWKKSTLMSWGNSSTIEFKRSQTFWLHSKSTSAWWTWGIFTQCDIQPSWTTSWLSWSHSESAEKPASLILDMHSEKHFWRNCKLECPRVRLSFRMSHSWDWATVWTRTLISCFPSFTCSLSFLWCVSPCSTSTARMTPKGSQSSRQDSPKHLESTHLETWEVPPLYASLRDSSKELTGHSNAQTPNKLLLNMMKFSMAWWAPALEKRHIAMRQLLEIQLNLIVMPTAQHLWTLNLWLNSLPSARTRKTASWTLLIQPHS